MDIQVEKLINSLSQIPDRFAISGDEQKLIDAICDARTADAVALTDADVNKLRMIVRRSEFSEDEKRQLGLIIRNIKDLKPVRKSKVAV